MAKAEVSSMSLVEVLRRRVKRPEYDKIPSQVEGISLRVEKDGPKPHLLEKDLGRLALLGATAADAKVQIKPLDKAQKEAKTEIQEFTEANPGFRGLDSEAENVSTEVNLSHSIEWNIPRLKEILGPASSAVIGETLVVTITLPLGFKTAKGLVTARKVDTALKAGVKQLGFDNKELATILRSEVVSTVNEKKVDELVVGGQIKLTEDAAVVSETLAISADPINPLPI